MPLTAGARLGSYEITAFIGEGGMGQVWRAHDTKLNRDVALKILPEAFAIDAERVARFQREAQLLASLNHPNIAQIYGLEESDGMRALVLELVDGETLDATGLGIPEAVTIARQIAEALEAAHEQGIIHRDLKPANIKVRPDGTVKILDFGLAKMLEAGGAGAAGGAGEAGRAGEAGAVVAQGFSPAMLSHSPTITTPAMTRMGVILGTAAYMSPEQAKGRPADKRSDVWAYGCVFYEMLTGKRPFDGEDVSDTLAAVLRGEPDLSALPAGVPVAIRTLIERCLEKDRRKRISDISTALFVLREPAILKPQARLDVTSSSTPLRMRPLWRRGAAIGATALIAAAIGGTLVWRFGAHKTPPPLVTRFSIPLGENQRLGTINRSILAISSDGSKVAYVADGRLYLRTTSDLEARPIPGTELGPPVLAVFDPVFSPDGNSLAFITGSLSGISNSGFVATIRRIEITGGTPVSIHVFETFPTGMSWGPGGIVVADVSGKIQRIPPSGGKPEFLLSVREDEIPAGPQLLSNGQLLFSVAKRENSATERWDKAMIVVQSPKSGERITLVDGGSNARYVVSGHLLYTKGGILFASPFDVQRMRVAADQTAVINGVRRASTIAGFPGDGAAQFSISDTGTLVFVPGPASTAATRQVSLVLVDRKGKVDELRVQAGAFGAPRVSPDGKRVAVDTDDEKEASVWIYELSAATAMRRLTLGGRNRFPIWTPDGERVAFQSDRDGDLGIFWQRIDGSPAERLTTAEKGSAHVPEAWAPQGDRFLFSAMKNSQFTLSSYSLQDKRATEIGGIQSTTPINAVFSPDGRWIAYQSGDFGRDNVFVQPFPPTGATFQISRNEDAHHPAWSRDGKELFYIPGPNQFAVRAVTTQPTFAFGDPILIPRGFTESLSPASQRGYDVMPDGRFVGIIQSGIQSGTPAAAQIDVVVNWFEELKSRAPIK